MITMKKKALVAMAMAAAMVAMPVVAGAVTSPGSQSDGTIGLDSSSPSQNNTNTGSQQSNAGSGVNKVAEATVVQGRNNERQEVTNITKDGSEVTMGLIEDASNSDVDQSIATGEAETAGLGDESVSQINGLNNGTKKASDLVPNAGLEEYANVGKTRAIISQKNGHDVRSTVNLYVSTLTAGKDIVIIYLDNNTRTCTVQEPGTSKLTYFVFQLMVGFLYCTGSCKITTIMMEPGDISGSVTNANEKG